MEKFIDNGDGTVTDTSTGLMWQKETAGQENWDRAIVLCENLTLAGYNDWRLPDINELQSIIDHSKYNPAIDTIYFPDTVSSGYWSSATYAYGTSNAWRLHFNRGLVYGTSKSSSYYVRAVRSGPTREIYTPRQIARRIKVTGETIVLEGTDGK